MTYEIEGEMLFWQMQVEEDLQGQDEIRKTQTHEHLSRVSITYTNLTESSGLIRQKILFRMKSW